MAASAASALPSRGDASVVRAEYPYFLASKAVAANTDLEVTNKFTLKAAARVALADEAAVEAAFVAAERAVPAMAALASFERKEILRQVVEGLKSRAEEMAVALTIEAGKPLKDSRGEVGRAISTFEIAMEESVRLDGTYEPLDINERAKGFSSVVRRFPIGVVSMVAPFNFPLNLVAHKVAPALAVGCPFVLKPASKTPIGALILGEILAGIDLLPEGAFSVLPCTRASAGLFTTTERAKLVSFTGSPDVGWDIKARAGKKKVVLELGGNAAVVVDERTDIADAVSRIVIGAFYQSGQSCISVQRIFVHESLYDEFAAALVDAIKKLKRGDPLDDDTFIGPLISVGDAERMESWVDEAVKGGGKVLVGGTRDGAFYDATIVENVPAGVSLAAEEAFGPVACLEKYSDFKAVVDRVNDSKFGLQAGVFTKDMNRAFYAHEHMDVGGVVINDVPSIRVDSQPYGGVKDSGIGREGVRWAMEDMSEVRVMVMRNIGAADSV